MTELPRDQDAAKQPDTARHIAPPAALPLLRTLDLLRQSKEVQGLKIEQIRGKTPAQFTFTFRWIGTSGS